MMILFDLDDTLFDHKKAEVYAASCFLKHFSDVLHHDEAAFCALWRSVMEKHAERFFRGEIAFRAQRRERMREIFRDAHSNLSDEQADERFAVYLQHYECHWSLFEDVLPCMDSLKDVPLGIISNGNTEQQNKKLRQMKIAERFSTVVISEEVGVSKPSAEIFLEACRRAGVAPRECVYVGDSLEKDVLGSRAVGMRGIWLNRGGPPKKDPGVEVIFSLADLKLQPNTH